MYNDLEPPRRSAFQEEAPQQPPRRSKTKKTKNNKNSKILSLGINKDDLWIVGAYDVPFFATVIALLTIGLIMLFSATYPYARQYESNSYVFIIKQVIFAIIGLAAMFAMSKLNYKVLKPLWPYITGVTGFLLVLVLFWHTHVKNFKRWLPLKFFTVQPSDIAKFTIILVMAIYICKFYNKMQKPKYGFVYPALITAAFCILIALERHLSCTVLMLCIGAVMMLVGGTNIKVFIVGAGLVAAVAVFVVMFPDVLMDYAGARIKAWLDKGMDPTGVRWQTNNSLYAIGSGGFFGVGLGNSKQKFLYVSEPQNDFIFAIVCEELGFVGAIGILALFALLFARGIKIAKNCPDTFGSLLVIGIVSQVTIQTILNILVVTDFIPNTGIALPFFSAGGSSMVMLLFEMGVVLSVSRKSSQSKV